ncbi:MAG: TfoX/Sxy family protein [Bacteroidota bacterium]
MAYNEIIADRVAEQLRDKKCSFIEKKMFGGIAFMIKNKMCIGVVKDEIMLRVLDEKYETILKMQHAKPMIFTGRAMKGFVFVEEGGFKTEKALEKWIDLGIEFGKLGIVKSKKK